RLASPGDAEFVLRAQCELWLEATAGDTHVGRARYNAGVDWQQHIGRVPGVMLGKPIFRGTRITVEFVLERLAQGARPEELVASHPPLTAEQVMAALAYAVSVVRQDELLLNAT